MGEMDLSECPHRKVGSWMSKLNGRTVAYWGRGRRKNLVKIVQNLGAGESRLFARHRGRFSLLDDSHLEEDVVPG